MTSSCHSHGTRSGGAIVENDRGRLVGRHVPLTSNLDCARLKLRCWVLFWRFVIVERGNGLVWRILGLERLDEKCRRCLLANHGASPDHDPTSIKNRIRGIPVNETINGDRKVKWVHGLFICRCSLGWLNSRRCGRGCRRRGPHHASLDFVISEPRSSNTLAIVRFVWRTILSRTFIFLSGTGVHGDNEGHLSTGMLNLANLFAGTPSLAQPAWCDTNDGRGQIRQWSGSIMMRCMVGDDQLNADIAGRWFA